MNKSDFNDIKKSKESINRYILLAFLAIILIASIICLIVAYKDRNDINNTLLYTYNLDKNIDYRVNLYNNSFIEKEYLEKGQTYISDLVKKIESNLTYNFTSSKKLNLKCTYNIVATVKGEYQSTANEKSNEVWQKEYILLNEKTITADNTTNLSIKEDSTIDFPFYNNEVSEFRKSLKLPINAYLLVSMNVKVFKIEDNNSETLLDDSAVDMSIPLNKQAFSITENYKEQDSKSVFKDIQTNEISILVYISILLFLLDMIIFTLNFRKISIKNKINSKYKSDLNKILKTYGDVIVEIVNPVKTKLSGLIDVKSFNEMIDLEEELRIPILFYEIPGRNEGWFTIIHDEILYRFVLKDDKSNNLLSEGEVEKSTQSKKRRNIDE